ncbi:MAG: hypothetical protein ACYCPW_11895 [Nitrososphaerales archaeon]
MDRQLVELAGRNWLTSELLKAGLEVARPERDRGIDLIAYRDTESREFVAHPIQMKAATKATFSLDPKYEKFPGLILVYVWNLGDSTRTTCFALSYEEALRIAKKRNYTNTRSWKTGGRSKKRGYTSTRPSKRLRELLKPYEMNSRKWLQLTNV